MSFFSIFKKKDKKDKENGVNNEVEESIKIEERMPIYQHILANLDGEGHLPIDFLLPDFTPSNQLKFADGAQDGIGVYHMDPADKVEETAQFFELLDKACQGYFGNAKDDLIAFLQKHRVIGLIDSIAEELRGGKVDIEPMELLKSAYKWATEEEDKEFVKMALAIMGLYNIGTDPAYRKVILTLGKSDEFALYTLVAISGWEDSDQLSFELAKQLHGWGKIHAVERLNAEIPEIKEWILKYGCKNNVMDSYSGITCAKKGDMISALRQDELDQETFVGIGVIIAALLEEGPSPGISIYEHGEEAIGLFLHHGERLCESLESLSKVLQIKSWYEKLEGQDSSEIPERCERIIERKDWKKSTLEAIQQADLREMPHVRNIASTLGIDIKEPIYQLIEKKPLEYGGYISTLYESPEYAQKITDLYGERLSHGVVATGMGDSLGFGEDFKVYNCLNSVLQGLQAYPLMGISLVKTALCSPVVSSRNGACNVLEAWSEALSKPMNELSPELFEVLEGILKDEVNEPLRVRIETFLLNEG